jgi:hypothetical protein
MAEVMTDWTLMSYLPLAHMYVFLSPVTLQKH